MKRALLTLATFATLTGFLPAGNAIAEEWFTPVTARPIAPVRPVVATDGERHLAYELVLTNNSTSSALVQRINRSDGKRKLAAVTGGVIGHMLKPFGSAKTTNVLGPGQSGYLLLDLALPRAAKLPGRIEHQFVVSSDPNPGTFATRYRTGSIRVLSKPAIEVAAPLRGAGWTVNNGCCTDFTSHRAAILPVNGGLHNSERYAIDFMKLQADGRLVSGPWEDLSSYGFFGDPIVSATRGKVVRVVKNIPETQPTINLPPAHAATAGGNYIVVRLARKRYAFYAHMQPGSARVKVGQKVRVGQVIGLLGNSGNSNAPHLHFHMMDGPDPLASNGLPYVFKRFGVEGRLLNFGDLFDGVRAQIQPRFAGLHSRQLPLNLQVVDFPNR